MSSRIEQIIDDIDEFIESCKYQPLSTTKIVVNKEEMEELGFTEEELRPICSVTGSSDLEELGHMTENELRHFAYTDVEGVKQYLKEKENPAPRL